MSKMYKTKMNIGGIDKTVVVVNYKTKKKTESKSVDRLHHIHILDRSGSMTGSIGQLIENVKKTIEFIPQNDYISIIWFSSAGQFKTLIKGATPNKDLYKLLDSIKSTLGCTCFSESLEEVGVIINDLQAICPNFNVSLFTDGETVVPWSDDEEERRIFKAINVWKDKVIALNTIGYGNYYNETLLKKIAAESMFGQMIHSSKIDQYMEIFSHNYERVSELVMDSVEIEANGAEILYLSNKSSKLNKDTLKMSMLDKTKNQFVLIGDGEFLFKLNGDVYHSNMILTSPSAATRQPVLYSYAYEKYYQGDRQYALDILAKTLNDKYLVDEQTKAFTFDECAEYINMLGYAAFNKGGRLLQGKCDDNYIPADDALCVMDILKLLVAGDNLYVYASDYNRIGLAVTDNFNLFKKDAGLTATPINELVFNKEKINVSIRSKIKGSVKINPKQAAKVGLPKEVNTAMFRNQTIIKDGNLNMGKIEVLIDDATFKKLLSYIPQCLHLMDVNENYIVDASGRGLVTLNLNNLPVINRTYLGEAGDIKNVMTNTWEIMNLEAQQKVANYFLKKLSKDSGYNPTQYTPEQIDVLRDHGLDANLLYVGVDTEKAQKNELDFYMARELSFDIKGYASLPSVADVIKKTKADDKLNGPGTIMKDYLLNLQGQININQKRSKGKPVSLLDDTVSFKGDIEFFEKEVNDIKKAILNRRIEVCSMKAAKVLTGAWFDGLTPDGKGNYTYTEGQTTLVVKTNKVKVFF